MTPHYLERSGAGLVAIGLGLVAFCMVLALLQHTAQAQSLEPATQVAQLADAQAGAADLSVTVTNDLTEVVPSMEVVYTITARNNSTGTITNAMLVDYVSPQYQPDSALIVGSNIVDRKLLTFTTGEPVYVSVTLRAGGSLNLVIFGIAANTAHGVLTNTAVFIAPNDVSDTNPANNTAIDVEPIRIDPLQISNTNDVTHVVIGQAITYTIIVTNPNDFFIRKIRITDTLPSAFVLGEARLSISNDITSALGIAAGNTQVTGTLSLGSQDVATLTVAGTIRFVPSIWLTNTAQVAASPEFTTALSNSATDVDLFEDARIMFLKTYLPTLVRLD